MAVLVGAEAGAQGPQEVPEIPETVKLLAFDGQEDDIFGGAVDLDGDLLLVGASQNSRGGAGSAYIYRRTGDGWDLVAKLVASDGREGAWLGYSVALSGSTAVVGAPETRGPGPGAVYVFEKDAGGLDNWGEVAKLMPSDAQDEQSFGFDVAVVDDLLVVGSSLDERPESLGGSAYVFERQFDDRHSWLEVAKLAALDPKKDNYFGSAVGIDDGWIAIGAPHIGPTFADGAVFLFRRDLYGQWRPVQKLAASVSPSTDGFGASLDLDSRRMVVGDSPLLFGYPAAYVFELQASGLQAGGPDRWVETARIEPPDSTAETSFGSAVALSGKHLLVPSHGISFSEDLGRGFVFQRDAGGPGEWGLVATLIDSQDDVVGFTVPSAALGPEVAAIGDPLEADLGDNAGAVFLYEEAACQAGIALDQTVVRPGDKLEITIRLQHNRFRTVNQPFHLWIEDDAGVLVASRSTEPLSFRHGETRQHRTALELPQTLAPGVYVVMLAIDGMQQGLAVASRSFQVRR